MRILNQFKTSANFKAKVCLAYFKYNFIFFSILNQIDVNNPRSQKQFKASIDDAWNDFASKIEIAAIHSTQDKVKLQIASDCTIHKKGLHFYCFTFFLFHQIGLFNSSMQQKLSEKFISMSMSERFSTNVNKKEDLIEVGNLSIF